MVRNIQRLGLWLAPLAFTGVLFYWPLVAIVALGLGQSWIAPLSGALGVIWFTIWQAVASTLITLVVGLPIAFVLYKRRFFASRFLRNLLVVPFVLPTIVVAIALEDLQKFFGENQILVILVAHLFLNLSLVVRIVGTAWMQIDGEIESAAELDGASAMQKFVAVSLALLRPALMSAAVLVFLFCLSSFAIILLLGGGQIETIETQIYFSLSQRLDVNTAAILSLVQTGLTAITFAISQRLGAQPFEIEADDGEQKALRLKARERVLTGAVILFLVALFIIPLSSVLTKAFTADGEFTTTNFANLGGRGARQVLDLTVFEAALNSVRNSVLAATLALIIGLLVAWLLRGNRRALIELYFVLPLGVSTVVLGFGYLIAFGGQPLPLRESWLVVPLVQALIATPMVIRILRAALGSLGPAGNEAAANAGASSWQIFRFIELPQLRPAVATAFAFALLVSLGEFGSSALLAYGDQSTLPVVLMRLIARPGEQNYGMAMAASALLILLIVVLASATELIRTRRLRHSIV